MTKKQLQVIVKNYDYLLNEKIVYKRISRKKLEELKRKEQKKLK